MSSQSRLAGFFTSARPVHRARLGPWRQYLLFRFRCYQDSETAADGGRCWIDYTVEMTKRVALLALLFSLALLEIYVCTTFLPLHRQHTYVTSAISDGLFLLAIFMSFTLVAIGAVCFVSPSTMQDYALKQNREHFSTNPFLDWMKTVNYLGFLRFIGIIVFVILSRQSFSAALQVALRVRDYTAK